MSKKVAGPSIEDEQHNFMSSIYTPQPKHLFLPAVWCARVILHGCVLIVVASIPCATPCFGTLLVTEAEAPVDQDESSEDVAICLQSRARVVGNLSLLHLPVPEYGRYRPTISRLARMPNAGHRLTNQLLAPLRC